MLLVVLDVLLYECYILFLFLWITVGIPNLIVGIELKKKKLDSAFLQAVLYAFRAPTSLSRMCLSSGFFWAALVRILSVPLVAYYYLLSNIYNIAYIITGLSLVR